MLLITTFPLLSILGLVAAQSTCDAGSAMTTDQFVAALMDASSASQSGSGTSCDIYPACPYCTQDPTFEMCRSWQQTQYTDMLNANILNGASSFGGLRRSLWPRISILECTDSEACVAATEDSFWCINPSSFDFQDSNGGSGNLDSNTYTMSNGQVTEVASTATALPTPTDSGSGSTATAAEEMAKTTASGTASGSGTGNDSSARRSTADNFIGMVLVAMGVGVLL